MFVLWLKLKGPHVYNLYQTHEGRGWIYEGLV